MSDLRFLKLDKSGGVARITFARPKHNVLNIDMMKELIVELEKLMARDLKPEYSAGLLWEPPVVPEGKVGYNPDC